MYTFFYTTVQANSFVFKKCNEKHLLCFQDDERYEQASDVRAQLKFFEQLDQIEKQRKDEQEREILMRAAKASRFHTHLQSVIFDVKTAELLFILKHLQ